MRLGLHFAFGEDGSLTARNGGPTLSLVRTGVAQCRDNKGFLRLVYDNEPRLEHGSYADNVCYDSEDLTDGTWSLGSNATSVKDAEDPFGVPNNAFTITDDATLGTHFIRRPNNLAVDTNKERMISLYVKAGTGRYLAVATREINAGNTQWNNVFDAEGGEWVVKGTANNTGHGQQRLPRGWWRIWYLDKTISVAYDDFSIGINIDGTLAGNSYSGSGDTMIVYGPMISHAAAGAWVSQNIDTNSEAATAWQLSQEGGAPIDVTGQVEPPREIAHLNPTILECPDDNAGGVGTVRHLVSETLPFAGDYIASFYIKLEENSSTEWVAIRQTGFGLAGTWTAGSVYVNLRTGQTGSAPLTDGFYGFKDKGNGWYRFWYHWRNDSVDLIGQSINVYQVLGDNSALSFTPRDNTRRIYVCGAMTHELRPNETEPLPYLPTYGVSQTNYMPPNYIPVTGTAVATRMSGPCDGLIAEEERTNILLRSTNFDFALDWNASGAGDITLNQIRSPDGNTNADRLIDNNTGGAGISVGTRQNVTGLATSTKYVFSVFARADQEEWVALNTFNFTTPANADTFFDLKNGVVGTIAAAHDGADMLYVGNGWYRCWISFTTDAVDTAGAPGVFAAEADGDTTFATADLTHSIFVYGGVLEISQSGEPSTFIFTNATAETRNLEVPDTTEVGWFREDEGTWFVEALPFNVSSTGWVFQMAANIQDYHGMGKNFNGTAHEYRAFTSVGDDGIINGVSWVKHEFTKMAGSYIAGELAAYAEGIFMGVDNTVSLPAISPTRFIINDDANGQGEFNGIIKEIRWYDRRLKREQLRKMTLSNRQTFPGFRNKDNALAWGRVMTARSKEADSDGDYTPFSNIG